MLIGCLCVWRSVGYFCYLVYCFNVLLQHLFSYSDGNIARHLMNSCIPLPHQHIKLFYFSYLKVCVHSACWGKKNKRNRQQLHCSRMFADMWAVNLTHVLSNFCNDLLTSDDCCQILNRFRHSRHSSATLAKTPAGQESQQLVQVGPMPMRLCVSDRVSCSHMARKTFQDQCWCLKSHTYGCAKESPSGVKLLF